MSIVDLKASVKITEGAELYASLLSLAELSRKHAELSAEIAELSDFIRREVDIQMSKSDDDPRL